MLLNRAFTEIKPHPFRAHYLNIKVDLISKDPHIVWYGARQTKMSGLFCQ